MKKSDFGVIAVIYAIALLFFVMTIRLPEAAQTYPMGLIVALAGLNTLYLARQGFKWMKTRRIENDMHILFKDFMPVQFAVVALGCIGYIVLMYLVGYYISSFVYLLGTMAFLRVKPWQILVAMGSMLALIYGVFTMFLNVPLPHGILLS